MGKQSKIKQRNPYVVHAIRRHAGSHTRPYKSERGELNREHAMQIDEGIGLGVEGDGYILDFEGDGIAFEAEDDLNPIRL